MKLNYQQDVVVLPGAVRKVLDRASDVQLRALIAVASEIALAKNPKKLAQQIGTDAKTVGDALAFWTAQGILCADGAVPVMAAQPEAEPAREKLKPADVMPSYNSTELAELMEKRAEIRVFLDEAQRTLGKMFNPSEVNVLIGMLDYLGMKEDCIILLLAHCKRIGKTNLRAIEKYAFTLADDEITDPETLEEKIRAVEEMRTFEGEIRTMFGMKSRSLTSKESKMFAAWKSFGYDTEIVRRAYEIAVNATNEPSVPYTNAILERWNAEGLRTAEEIDRYIEAQKAAKDGQNTLGNSFDTDEFFQAALKRSFPDKKQ